MPATPPVKAVSRWQPRLIAAAAAGALLTAGWMGWSSWRSADLLARSRAAAGRGDWDRAAGDLDRLAWYRPRDRSVLRLHVEAALQRGDPEAAAGLLALVPSSSPDAVEARLTQGRLLMQAFLPRAAEAAFRDCLHLDPGSDAARLALIAILAVQHRGPEYEAEAWALLDKGAQPIKALRLLAQAAPAIPADTFIRTADEGDVLRRCLAADPDDPHTRAALARFERGRGRIEEALRLIEPSLRGPAPPPEASVEWAACLLDQGELESLRPLFEHPAGAVSRVGSFWLLRGEWARRSGLETEALASYREAVRLDPRSPDAWYRLGIALRDTGPEAAKWLDAAQKARELKDVVARLPDNSRDPDQLARVGRLCAEIGRNREARAWFALALRAAPDHAEARAALAALRPGTAPARAGESGGNRR